MSELPSLPAPPADYFDITDSDASAYSFKDQVVVITGASSGIGLATAELFSSLGAKVYAADVSPLPRDIPNTTFVSCDVSSWSSQTSLFKTIIEKEKRVDHVIANAGIAPTANYLQLQSGDDGELKEPDVKCVEVNLRGAINTATLGLHYLKQTESQKGSIVITASAASYYYNLATDYSLTKHGVTGFMRGLVTSLYSLHPHIRINTVNPFWTESNIVPPGWMQKMGLNPQPASAVAKGIVKLCGDEGCNGWGLFVKDGRFKELDQRMTAIAGFEANGRDVRAVDAWAKMGVRLKEGKGFKSDTVKKEGSKM